MSQSLPSQNARPVSNYLPTDIRSRKGGVSISSAQASLDLSDCRSPSLQGYLSDGSHTFLENCFSRRLDRCDALSADTKVGGYFCAKRCGPSRRRAQNASTALRKFVRRPKRCSSTLSVLFRPGDHVRRCPLMGAKRALAESMIGAGGWWRLFA
jgi:hypothetical protein